MDAVLVRRAKCGARLLADPNNCRHRLRVLVSEHPPRYRCLMCDARWTRSKPQPGVPGIPSHWDEVGLDALRLWYVRWKLDAVI